MPWIIVVNYFLLFFIVFKWVKNRIARNLLLIYLSYWFLSLFLCSLHINKRLFQVEDTTYYLLVGHLYAFVFGYLVIRQKYNYKSVTADIDISRLLKNIPFWLLFSACFVFILNLYVKQRDLLLFYSLSDVRGDFIELILEGSNYLFYSLVATGLYHFCICLSFYMLFFDRRWFFIVLFLSYSFLFAMLGGGRHQFAIFIYYLIGFYILKNYIKSSLNGCKSKFIISNKVKFLVTFFCVLSFIIMSLFTRLRKDVDAEVNTQSVGIGLSELGETVMNYSLGPVTAFDIGLKSHKFKNKRYYGTATIGGTERILYLFVIRYVNKDYKLAFNEVTGDIQTNRIMIGSDVSWNYAYTSCFYYYCDFGIAGIFLIPFILGILFRGVILMIEKRISIYNIAIFLFVSFCFYDSVFSCYLYKTISVTYILVLIVLHNITKSKSLFANYKQVVKFLK